MELLTRLPIEKRSVDVALLQPGAVDSLGPKVFRNIFRETSRVLKPDCRFMVFMDVAQKLPATAANYFDIERKFRRDATRCYRLIRKARRRPKPLQQEVQEADVVVELPKLQRPKPLSVGELESALVEEDE